jgi:hypothetical protein
VRQQNEHQGERKGQTLQQTRWLLHDHSQEKAQVVID